MLLTLPAKLSPMAGHGFNFLKESGIATFLTPSTFYVLLTILPSSVACAITILDPSGIFETLNKIFTLLHFGSLGVLGFCGCAAPTPTVTIGAVIRDADIATIEAKINREIFRFLDICIVIGQ
jgi:hypothetical protein